MEWPAVRSTVHGLEARVLAVDHFGNLVTNIERRDWELLFRERAGTVECGDRVGIEWVRTYGERPAGTVVALEGSSGRLEVAVVNGHAARTLGASVDTSVFLRRLPLTAKG